MSHEEVGEYSGVNEPRALAVNQPAFFPVSLTKLAVLSVCTLGLYEIYWFYKNWYFVKRREKSDILPAARSIFAYFFCYALFLRIADQSHQSTGDKPPAGALAIGWIVVTLLWKLPGGYWLLSYAAVLFLLPIQSSINAMNTQLAPEHDRNARFSAWNIAATVLGGLFVILGVIGSFLRDEQV